MTIGGVLSELNNLLKADDIPIYYKPSIEAVMDCIKLEAVKEQLPYGLEQLDKYDKGFVPMVNCVKDMSLVISQEPKIGYWVKHNTINNTYYYDCSLCGCVAPCTETADSYLWKLSNFCPDCGAKMVESQAESDRNLDDLDRDSL